MLDGARLNLLYCNISVLLERTENGKSEVASPLLRLPSLDFNAESCIQSTNDHLRFLIADSFGRIETWHIYWSFRKQ